MKRILFTCIVIFSLASCGGGKHEPIVKDSKMVQPADSVANRSTSDSLHINPVNPGDTTSLKNK